MNYTIIEGKDLDDLLTYLKDMDVNKISIMERRDGVAIKINESIWSPTIGRRVEVQ